MKCLTLWRPWPWVIFHAKKSAETGHGRKLVENRDWPPPKHIMGDALALHAGKTWDREGAAFIQRTLGLTGLPPEAWQEGIIGTTKVVGVALNATDVAPDQRVWFFGSHGWLLDERATVALPKPIATKGAQGLWTLPPDITTEIDKLIPVEVMCPVHGVGISGPGQACAACIAGDPAPPVDELTADLVRAYDAIHRPPAPEGRIPTAAEHPFRPEDLGHVGGDLPPLMPDELAELTKGLKPVPRPSPPKKRPSGREAYREEQRRREVDEANRRMGNMLGFDDEDEGSTP